MPVKNLSATSIAAKWARNLQASGQAITDGVNAVTTSPGQLAAAQQGRWLAAIQESAPRWAAAVGAVSLQYWQQSMIQKGIPRVQSGATQGQPKMESFMSQWMPFEQSVVGSLPPRGSLEENIARAAAVARANAQARGRFRQAGRAR